MKSLRKPIVAVLCAVMLAACIAVDYDFKGKAFKPRVTVNALISPQEPFTVSLHWSGTYTEGNRFKPVSDASIRLYEDRTEVVSCAASADGVTPTQFVATAGRRYRLVVTVPGYGELSAETTIPHAPAATLAFAAQRGWYRHFDLTAMSVPDDAKAVWIRGKRKYEGFKDIYEFYTTSAFVDQVNGTNDTYEADEKGSTIDFEQFLRIPYENRGAVVPLRFSVFGAREDRHVFRIITASDTYDRYTRSRYKQELNTEWGAEENPFTEQITVYSNIDGGLGIFAGYNYLETDEL